MPAASRWATRERSRRSTDDGRAERSDGDPQQHDHAERRASRRAAAAASCSAPARTGTWCRTTSSPRTSRSGNGGGIAHIGPQPRRHDRRQHGDLQRVVHAGRGHRTAAASSSAARPAAAGALTPGQRQRGGDQQPDPGQRGLRRRWRRRRAPGRQRRRRQPCSASSWKASAYRVRLYNKRDRSNNVAGLAGGGISIADAAYVDITHNTIVDNDSTGTAGAAFTAGPLTSVPQPAGIVARGFTPPLAALLPGPTGANVRIANSIVWHNRTFYFGALHARAVCATAALHPSRSALGPGHHAVRRDPDRRAALLGPRDPWRQRPVRSGLVRADRLDRAQQHHRTTSTATTTSPTAASNVITAARVRELVLQRGSTVRISGRGDER